MDCLWGVAALRRSVPVSEPFVSDKCAPLGDVPLDSFPGGKIVLGRGAKCITDFNQSGMTVRACRRVNYFSVVVTGSAM
jgi:hypothetical protein